MLHLGDLFDVLPTLPADSVDACVTDPPYGIGFMGKEWDSFLPSTAAKKAGLRQYGTLPRWKESNPNLKGRTVNGVISASQIEYDRSLEGQRAFQEWSEKWAREVYRVLKPGAHLIVCGAPRSFHRMTCGLEDAGLEIRDCLSWLYGQGFPKSLNLGNGRGTALKPSWEPCVLARKPLNGTTNTNVEHYGTGALNIEACRIGDSDTRRMKLGGRGSFPHEDDSWEPKPVTVGSEIGRWPANVVIDEETAVILDEQSGELVSGANIKRRHCDETRNIYGPLRGLDVGGASRFYYVAKPSREERDMGCYDLPTRSGGEVTDRKDGSAGVNHPRAGTGRTGGGRNFHPTVKPVELMRWFVRLITPPNGVVLDCFAGSGTTGMACAYEQRQFIGIEREADYIEIAKRRIAAVAPLFSVPARPPQIAKEK